MASKAQRKRIKSRRSITLPGGDTATAPATQGMRPPQEDARKTASDARARIFGKSGDDALHPMHGSQAGCCISSTGDDAAKLWQTWQDINAARRNYRMRILGTTGDPKCAAISMLPDAMQTDTSLTIDIRTAEERDTAAKRAWRDWEARINSLPQPQMKWAIRGSMDGGTNGLGGNLWANNAKTTLGQAFVAALQELTP